MIRIKRILKKFSNTDAESKIHSLLSQAEKTLKISALNKAAFQKLNSYNEEYKEITKIMTEGDISNQNMNQIRSKQTTISH